MIILGIDPGYDRCGWGVIEKKGSIQTYISCGLIQTSKKDSPHLRLAQVATQIQDVLKTHKPDLIGIESLFFSKNVTTAIGVGEARGAILATIGQWSTNVLVKEYNPMQVKLAVTGDGRADKKAVEKLVRLQLKGLPEKLLDDTLDALGICLAVETRKI